HPRNVYATRCAVAFPRLPHSARVQSRTMALSHFRPHHRDRATSSISTVNKSKRNGRTGPSQPTHPTLPMTKSKKPTPVELLLADGSAPLEQRREFLKMLLNDPSPDAGAAVQSLFMTLATNGAAQV